VAALWVATFVEGRFGAKTSRRLDRMRCIYWNALPDGRWDSEGRRNGDKGEIGVRGRWNKSERENVPKGR